MGIYKNTYFTLAPAHFYFLKNNKYGKANVFLPNQILTKSYFRGIKCVDESFFLKTSHIDFMQIKINLCLLNFFKFLFIFYKFKKKIYI